MDKRNHPVSISVPNTYAQVKTSPQAEGWQLSAVSARKSTSSARSPPAKLQHVEVVPAAPARKAAYDNRYCVEKTRPSSHDLKHIAL